MKPRPHGAWEFALSWITIALASAAISGVVSLFDKTVLHRYATTPLTLPLLIGIAQTLIGVVVLSIVRIPDGVTTAATLTGLLSGLVFGVSGILLISVLYRQEVSRTIPVIQTAPIFAASFALVFLGESITALQWAAILATVVGAIALSLRFDAGSGEPLLQRSFFLLILGAMIFAAANVIGKAALEDLPVLYTHGLRSLGLGATFLLIGVRPGPIGNVKAFVRERSPALMFVGVNELIIANSSLVLLLWALSLGPASLVVAVAGTRAMFVVLFSTVLALVWKGALGEDTTRRAIAIKAGSTTLIVAGVVGIAF
jgi:transporter family protein